MTDNAKKYKSLFVTYFDGCYNVDPWPSVSTTYAMGICKLDYIENKNKLVVHLRRPGLLIGKGGRIIDSLSNYLGIDIDIIEINLMES